MEIKIISFQKHGDERGSLVALDDKNNVPFQIRRVYYVYGTRENVRRGFHAHKALTQLAIVVRGSCRFHLDDGHEQVQLCMDSPSQGLMLPPLLWHEMYDFSEDCVLMVLADDHYDEADYLRDHQEFLKHVRK